MGFDLSVASCTSVVSDVEAGDPDTAGEAKIGLGCPDCEATSGADAVGAGGSRSPEVEAADSTIRGRASDPASEVGPPALDRPPGSEPSDAFPVMACSKCR